MLVFITWVIVWEKVAQAYVVGVTTTIYITKHTLSIALIAKYRLDQWFRNKIFRMSQKGKRNIEKIL